MDRLSVVCCLVGWVSALGALGALDRLGAEEVVPLRSPLTTVVAVSDSAADLDWVQIAGPAVARIVEEGGLAQLVCPEPGTYRLRVAARYGSQRAEDEVLVAAVADADLAAAAPAGGRLHVELETPSRILEHPLLSWQVHDATAAGASGSGSIALRAIGGALAERADVAWIAIEPGAVAGDPGGAVAPCQQLVNHHWTPIPVQVPSGSRSEDAVVLIAAMQDTRGGDLAVLRQRRPEPGLLELRVQEERSSDEEIGHASEPVAVAAFSGPGLLRDDAGRVVGAVGRAEVATGWRELEIAHSFRDPVLICSPPGDADAEPVVTRTRVGADGIAVRLEEWPHQDGEHLAETVGYLVLEAGRHRIGGRWWQAGIRRGLARRPIELRFGDGLDRIPVLFTQIQGTASGLPMTVRLRSLSATGAELRLQGAQFPTTNPELEAGRVELRYRVRFAEPGRYRCWLRARHHARGFGRVRLELVQGEHRQAVELGLRDRAWTWTGRRHPRREDGQYLMVPAAGTAELVVRCEDPDLELDALALASDSDWRPEAGAWLRVTGTPRAVVGEPAPLVADLATERFTAAGQWRPDGRRILNATVRVPADAPADLGVGAWVGDTHGAWFQRTLPRRLGPGLHRLRIPVDATTMLAAEPAGAVWNAVHAVAAVRGGLYFFSSTPSAAELGISDLAWRDEPTAPVAVRHRLLDLDLGAPLDATGALSASTGERWQLTCRPSPLPTSPADRERFALWAEITEPDGGRRNIDGFWFEPMALRDRGDREQVAATSAGRFALRFRPQRPGLHRVVLHASWDGEARVRHELPPLMATGPARDPYVRVDAEHPRFFRVGDDWFWPIGLNIRSVFDLRSRDRLGTRLTPDRRVAAYEAYFARLAAAGGNAVEIWMAPWNLALEWRADWPGYHGIGRYHQGNAWRLDRILDAAWTHGIRVNLVIHNHGQASARTDREWTNNPYSAELGGPVDEARAFFTDPAALAGQERLRRYLVARYADHPAILGWKLWSEVNLTGGDQHELVDWHEQAAARWHALDTYGHPVTTHWSGNYRTPNRAIVALPGIDYVCIDAYHRDDFLADLVWRSTEDPQRGLAAFAKPLLITEYGGTSGGASDEQLAAEHVSAAWAALTGGHAGAPMLWWWEWVDQNDRWDPYRAISRFLVGEDPRHAAGRPLVLGTPAGLWGRAWSTPERVLAYICAEAWGRSGAPGEGAGGELVVPDRRAGRWAIEWWDSTHGRVIASETIAHPGGPLSLAMPAVTDHLACKVLWSP